MTRPALALGLAVIAALLLAAGGTLLYVKREVAPERPFAARVVSSLDDRSVQGLVAEQTVDALLSGAGADLLPLRPLLVGAMGSLVDSPGFRRVTTFAIADAHRALVRGHGSVTVELERSGREVLAAVRSVSPAIARRTSGDTRPLLTRINRDNIVLRIMRRLIALGSWATPLLLGALLAAAGALAAATDRRRILVALGAAMVGAGLLVAGVEVLGERVATGHGLRAAALTSDRDRRAVHAVWEALFGDLRTAGLAIAAGGLLLVLVAVGLGSARSLPARAREQVRAHPVPAALRNVALVVVGAVCVLAPGTVARTAIVVLGVALVAVGADALAAPLRARWSARSARGTRAPASRPSARNAALAVVGAAVVAVSLTAAAAVALRVPPLPAFPQAPRAGCNGSRAACDRRLDEVLWPATHNSYAASDQPGWYFANQRRGIAAQLDDGITALLIDVHWGVPDAATGRVRTDLRAEGADRNKVAAALDPAALRAAERVAGRVGAAVPADGRRLYLCHTLCELGAEPLDAELAVIGRHLDAHPASVLMLVVEDYVRPAEVRGALQRAGLLGEVATLDRAKPLPTLGELIRDGHRLVVFAEKEGGAYPWYMPAFTFMQDTPLGNRRGADFTCDRFRGDANSPLLLLNHWIDRFPPRPSDNAAVGTPAFLGRRIDRCSRDRGTGPGVVAVDFYERTSVIAQARRYNR